ncbi:hypothetical protein A3K80_05280 [Candidatus Bathyarchaeota archaeon RBG_13_38_9]|nr:MAG: hypothetical protein A3K80_05280 [Candidatus Bathyarchaeota archaeon RBG_13_38_9]
MQKSLIIRIVFTALILYSFYLLNFPPIYIQIMALLFISMIIFRSSVYNKIVNLLDQKLPFIQKWSPWKKKILMIIIFLIIYAIIKQIVFFFLLLMGIDLQQILVERISQTSSDLAHANMIWLEAKGILLP